MNRTCLPLLLSLSFVACGSDGPATPDPDPGPLARARCSVYDEVGALEAIATAATQDPGFIPAHPPLPWAHFDGERFRLDDGRELIVRGLDYAYNTVGYTDLEVPLYEADFARMAAWGANVLRVRLRDTRSGWYPFTAPEPGYLEGLDDLIELAGAHGIYVIIATNGVEQLLGLDERPHDVLFEQARFRAGSRANEHWLGYMASIFARYRNTSTVLGFDAINEDYAFPPETHDAECMRPAHEAMLTILRTVDQDHVYFQQPAGWDYNNDLSVSMGHDLGDPNRVFCTKWFAMNTAQQRMDEMLTWAEQAGTPLFVCEAWVWDIITQPRAVILGQQRTALGLMDAHAVGWITNGYVPLIGLLTRDRSAIHLADEWVRPYPQVVAGERQSLQYDFSTRTLTMDLTLSGTGETTIFVPASLTYPTGFEVTSGTDFLVVAADGSVVAQQGTTLSWDAGGGIVTLVDQTGAVEVVVESTDAVPGPVDTRSTRLDYTDADFIAEDEIVRPVYTFEDGEGTLRARMLESGDFLPEEVDCILAEWETVFTPHAYEGVARAALMHPSMREPFGRTIAGCLPVTD